MTQNMMNTKIMQMRYSCLRNSMAPWNKKEDYIGDFLADFEQELLLMTSDGKRAFFLKLYFLHILDMNIDDKLIVKEGPYNTENTADNDGPSGSGKGHRGLAKFRR